MIHWCLLDKDCREFTWHLHWDFTKWGGKHHYQLNMPYDPTKKKFGFRAWSIPKVIRVPIPKAILNDQNR